MNHKGHEGSRRFCSWWLPSCTFVSFVVKALEFVEYTPPTTFCFAPHRRRILGMISKDLLDMLVCPLCKKSLLLKDDGQSLKCGECRRVYPIRDSIPIMLIDEATTDPS